MFACITCNRKRIGALSDDLEKIQKVKIIEEESRCFPNKKTLPSALDVIDKMLITFSSDCLFASQGAISNMYDIQLNLFEVTGLGLEK